MLITLLLEKLYGHKSDLEFIMQVQETHYCGKSQTLKDQYFTCLGNIRDYEILQQQHYDEPYSDSPRKQY